MPRRRIRPRSRAIKVAAMVASGKTRKEVATELGISESAVGKTVNKVLTYTEFEDIQQCRALVNRRLDSYRRPLLEIAGLVDAEQDMTPAREARARAKKTQGENPTRVAAVRALIDIERRRADMFGWDAPKLVFTPPPPAGSLAEASLEEIADECERNNIPLPPGVRDELARRTAGAVGPVGEPPKDPATTRG